MGYELYTNISWTSPAESDLKYRRRPLLPINVLKVKHHTPGKKTEASNLPDNENNKKLF